MSDGTAVNEPTRRVTDPVMRGERRWIRWTTVHRNCGTDFTFSDDGVSATVQCSCGATFVAQGHRRVTRDDVTAAWAPAADDQPLIESKPFIEPFPPLEKRRDDPSYENGWKARGEADLLQIETEVRKTMPWYKAIIALQIIRRAVRSLDH